MKKNVSNNLKKSAGNVLFYCKKNLLIIENIQIQYQKPYKGVFKIVQNYSYSVLHVFNL